MKKLLFILSMLSFAACTKEGPAGPAGANGSANVSSYQFNITNWNQMANDFYNNLSTPAITNAGVDAVVVSILDNGQWATLPATNLFNAGDYMNVYVTNGNVQVDYIWTSSPGPVTIKVEVIPPQ